VSEETTDDSPAGRVAARVSSWRVLLAAALALVTGGVTAATSCAHLATKDEVVRAINTAATEHAGTHRDIEQRIGDHEQRMRGFEAGEAAAAAHRQWMEDAVSRIAERNRLHLPAPPSLKQQ
jgi:hypothetical protein